MTLLFDHNLSPRLVQRLADVFPLATHVALVGLADAPDAVVWAYAGNNALTIVTKDSDFTDIAVLRGVPPKVIWLRIGNCTTLAVELLIRHHTVGIMTFLHDPSAGTFEIS